MMDFRREGPRIGVEAMCWELVDGRPQTGLAVDLSSMGVRIERPYVGGPTRREVPLEIEVPGIDEVIWAKADVCFDIIVPARSLLGGPRGLVRRTGYRIVAAATRDLRMIKELVFDTYRATRDDEIDFSRAACYLRA